MYITNFRNNDEYYATETILVKCDVCGNIISKSPSKLKRNIKNYCSRKCYNDYNSNKIRIFVYGSLKKGQYNHGILKNSKFIGNHKISGYQLYSLGVYPGIKKGKGYVYGEVYEVDLQTFKIIDSVEVGAGYKIVSKTIFNRITYFYEYLGGTSSLIKTGIWLGGSK